jgi:hypothetical protein
VPERLGDADGDLLRSADEAILLGPSLDVGEQLEAAGRAQVEGDVEQRHLLGLRTPDGSAGDSQQPLRLRAQHRPVDPRGEAGRVEASGGAPLPGGLGVDAPRQPVELAQAAVDVEQGERVEPRDRAAVAAKAAVEPQQVRPLGVGRERLDPDLGGERGDPVLGRPDPLPAHLDHPSLAEVGVDRPPADPVARLEHQRLGSGRGERPGGGEPGEAGADDDHPVL